MGPDPSVVLMNEFELIPAVDLMSGAIVRAYKGERNNYQPLGDRFAGSDDPLVVIETLMARSGSKRLYLADLDGIMGQGSHHSFIQKIENHFPKIELWVDQGNAKEEEILAIIERQGHIPIMGSEMFSSIEPVAALSRSHPEDFILSLDFDGEGFCGPPELLEKTELWPKRIIVMTLQNIGSRMGPDFSILDRILTKAQNRHVFAAGGMRNMSDALKLSEKGACGVLLASAFYDGEVTEKKIAAFRRKQRFIKKS